MSEREEGKLWTMFTALAFLVLMLTCATDARLDRLEQEHDTPAADESDRG